MGYQSVATYYARKPLRAEHPVGTGTIVEYAVGDVIPAGDWGAAANWLVENGKAAVMFENVYVDEEAPSGGGASSYKPLHEITQLEAVSGPPSAVASGVPFPQHIGAGYFVLSDGSRLRGKEAALEAQEALDSAEEA